MAKSPRSKFHKYAQEKFGRITPYTPAIFHGKLFLEKKLNILWPGSYAYAEINDSPTPNKIRLAFSEEETVRTSEIFNLKDVETFKRYIRRKYSKLYPGFDEYQFSLIGNISYGYYDETSVNEITVKVYGVRDETPDELKYRLSLIAAQKIEVERLRKEEKKRAENQKKNQERTERELYNKLKKKFEKEPKNG